MRLCSFLVIVASIVRMGIIFHKFSTSLRVETANEKIKNLLICIHINTQYFIIFFELSLEVSLKLPKRNAKNFITAIINMIFFYFCIELQNIFVPPFKYFLLMEIQRLPFVPSPLIHPSPVPPM